ncbi:MAG: hypothetical protein IKX18_05490 [Muribaculaceae bacterium]|nr:hypothetical protein [Muribaculaceae bacterium]
MKKLLLIAAMAAVALGASAGYTIQKVWTLNANDLGLAWAQTRQGFGMDGKFYINDKNNAEGAVPTIYIVDENGKSEMTLPGGLNCGITRDEAGNLIVSNWQFPSNAAGGSILVVDPATGEILKTYTIPATCGFQGRSDFIGFAKGDMTQDGMLMLHGGNTGTDPFTAGVVVFTVTDGEVNTDECYLAPVDGIYGINTTVINYFKDINNEDSWIYCYRSGNDFKLAFDGEDIVKTALSLPNKGASNGVFPFIWEGKEYYMYPNKPNYLDGFAIAESGAEAPIIEVEPTISALINNFQANWVNAEVDEDGVTIYHYYPGGQISVYRLTKTTDYTVAGTPNLFGSEWDPTNTDNDMVMGEDGIYTWTKDAEMTAGTEIEFKVTQDHSWDHSWPSGNIYYKFTEDGTYNIKITFNPENNEVKLFINGEDPFAEMVYTVVGPGAVFGTSWNTNDTNNDMVMGEDGIYTWTKEGVSLEGDFEYKIVGNHAYEIYQYPLSGNIHVPLTEGEGVYTIVITFDPDAQENPTTCTLTKTGSITPVEHTYTVAGTENLFGSFWAAADADNDMVKGEDGIYTWTKDNVVFAEAAHIEFKVVQDHAWDYSWPSSNYEYDVEAGTYNFVITFNPDTHEVTCVATPVSAGLRGDVDNSGSVDISDATTLINFLLNGNSEGMNMDNANCDLQGGIDISDATTLINFLLNGTWPN